MGSNSKVNAALKAMKKFGFSPDKVKRVLKNLLKVYDNNWEFIEAENYSALADAILELEESKDEDECQQPPYVLNSGRAISESPSKRQKPNVDSSKQACINSEPTSPRPCVRDKQADIIPPQSNLRTNSLHVASRGKRLASERIPSTSGLKEPKTEPGVDDSHEKDVTKPGVDDAHEKDVTKPGVDDSHEKDVTKPGVDHSQEKGVIEPGVDSSLDKDVTQPSASNLVKPKSEPFTGEFPPFEVPIAVVYPDASRSHHVLTSPQSHVPCPSRHEDLYINGENFSMRSQSNVLDAHTSDTIDAAHEEIAAVSGQVCEEKTNLDLVPDDDTSSTGNVEIASSLTGEVKLSLSCGSLLNRPGFHVPNIDEVLKLIEEKCLKSYRIIEPNFSFKKLMKEFCQAFLELGTDDSTSKLEERQFTVTTEIDALKKSNLRNVLSGTSCLPENIIMPESASNGSPVPCSFPEVMPMPIFLSRLQTEFSGDNYEKAKDTEWKESEDPKPSSLDLDGLVLIRHGQFSFGDTRPLHDVNDISKGEEKVRISVVNDVSSEECPPTFHYIPRNIVYQSAYVNFSLARIGHEDCCPDCFGDCLASSIPCACARETGGEFAYTPDGLVKKEFLDDIISMNQNPHKHRLFYCNDCPMERSKNDVEPEQCKGHLVRKFIKECWSKCGCSMQCANRVVQRGITCNLQVFLTSEGKGWGLRTLQDLPRGTFVCEYVGEILTNTELYERNARSPGNEKHTYPVLLDADWGSEGVLKDEEALCLDATFYGNVARFINHRCSDANLVEVPVEVETPDRHYYHLAFFTTNNVNASEELTWDYGIDFDDLNHPVKAFRCRCGSKYCRDAKRSSRAKRLLSMSSIPTPKSTALVLR